jgi:hypothetical protein
VKFGNGKEERAQRAFLLKLPFSDIPIKQYHRILKYIFSIMLRTAGFGHISNHLSAQTSVLPEKKGQCGVSLLGGAPDACYDGRVVSIHWLSDIVG